MSDQTSLTMGSGSAASAPSRSIPDLILSLSYAVPRTGIPAVRSFRRWLAAALHGAGRRQATEVCIRMVDWEESRAFNRDYRGRDRPTNVLSFAADLPPLLQSPLIGDLVICAPLVMDEAVAQGKRPRDHFAHLTVHGTLHLLGYDHLTDTEADQMEALEVRILAALGIPDPYLLPDDT